MLADVHISSLGYLCSKYEHRRASALLRNIQNIRICTKYERISIKNSLPYLKRVLRLSCTSPTLSALFTSTCPQLSYLATFICLDKVTVVLTKKKWFKSSFQLNTFFGFAFLLFVFVCGVFFCSRNSRNPCGGTLVTRAYIKESTFSWNIQSYSQYRKNLDLLEQGPQGIGR